MTELKIQDESGNLRAVSDLSSWCQRNDIKVPTMNTYLDKARKDEVIKPAMTLGGMNLYFEDELAELPVKYGRKPSVAMVLKEQHEQVVRDNVRLAADNATQALIIDGLEHTIQRLMDRLAASESYTNSIITGESSEVLEYESV